MPQASPPVLAPGGISSDTQSTSHTVFDGAPITVSPVSTSFPPSNPPGRNLILCFDGTGDQFDSDNSNIVQFFSILRKGDKDKQLVYYQAGIGTYTTPQIATPLFSKISKAFDEAVAWNLDAHVMGGYEFLMQNYTTGDRICIFGFSRGAYTARSLAGMIHKVGLLPVCNHQQVPFAYKMYTRDDPVGWAQSSAFKQAFSIDVDIEFMGVWDTVSSVGLIARSLPFTTSNTIVHTFRHAISLDERRVKFKPNFWQGNPVEEHVAEKPKPGTTPHVRPHPNKIHSTDHEVMHLELERKHSKHVKEQTDVKEVWFAGCHCDVGGGSVKNEVKVNLARIPLRWMIRECYKARSGIIFESKGLLDIGLDPKSLSQSAVHKPRPPALSGVGSIILSIPPRVKSMPAPVENDPEPTPFFTESSKLRRSEEQLDLEDALSPIYDMLAVKPPWWILEVLPIRVRYPHFRKFEWNFGKGRNVPTTGKGKVLVHRSVRTRMEALHVDGSQYKPRAAGVDWEGGEIEWVD
ncbi:hypothetical protein FB45DRAFT_835209 [Roridomyces roridus]|uniref:T6SS Phospholipase effector Tle1-like catalytic domain-containing protein n=1 Tax=Roridomyces roridus TaxID=1738132 RepID=A0AAD7FLP1_9AGAR|nr:hypothetical protein FB45DRAFT_835209 [Roridomyces roridus]